MSSPSESSRGTRRTARRSREAHLDFKVDIPEFEGKLDLDEFLDWLQTVERVFDFKDIPNEKKVKLVALKLRAMPQLGGPISWLRGPRKERGRSNRGGKE